MARKHEKIAKEAKSAVERWRSYFRVNIEQYHEFHTFVLKQQWKDEDEEVFKSFKKVPMQMNKLAPLVNSLLGEQQQNTPQLQVRPKTDCDEQTAAIREAIVKNKINGNEAKRAYQIAAGQAFIGGFGMFSIATEYVNKESFDQDIKIYWHKDATRGFWDVSAEHPNKIDGMCAGIITRMSRDKFAAMYGHEVEKKIGAESGYAGRTNSGEFQDPSNNNDFMYSFADENAVTVIDYYKREFEVVDKIYRLSTGDVVKQEELDVLIEESNLFLESLGEENQDRKLIYINGEPVRIEDKRDIKKHKVKHYKIAGDYILDESEFPAEFLPIVYVDQNSFYDKNGRQICRPFVIDAKDAQIYLNYIATQSAYVMKVSRYDQFLVCKENVRGQDTQQIWRDPTSMQGALFYDKDPDGNVPQRLNPPELPQSFLSQYERAMNDIYTSTGLYAARLGQQGNEVSGAAIDARTRQGSYSTYVAFNSINNAIAAAGTIINQMISKVYDTPRVLDLMMPDTGMQKVAINQPMDEYGQMIQFDMTKGEFEVTLEPGASYEGQKAEARESMQFVLQNKPEVFDLIADLYIDSLPMPNTIEMKNRLKAALVPPEIIQAGKTGQLPPKQPQQDPQAEALQMQTQIKMQELRLKEQELQLKKEKQDMEMQIDLERLQAEKLEAAAQLQEQQLRYNAEMNRTNSQEQIAHANNITRLLTSKV